MTTRTIASYRDALIATRVLIDNLLSQQVTVQTIPDGTPLEEEQAIMEAADKKVRDVARQLARIELKGDLDGDYTVTILRDLGRLLAA